MTAGQIHDMDSRALPCRPGVVVAAKNLQLFATAHCDLCDVGQQVVGNV
jgi:hypothetical protein